MSTLGTLGTLGLAMGLSLAAPAQAVQAKSAQPKVLVAQNFRDLREQQREIRQDLRRLGVPPETIRELRRDQREALQDLREARRDLRRDYRRDRFYPGYGYYPDYGFYNNYGPRGGYYNPGYYSPGYYGYGPYYRQPNVGFQINIPF